MENHPITFNADLIRRYDTTGPRYTSYPTAAEFTTEFGEAEYKACAIQGNNELSPRPLSLYFHIPFCSTICYYCACNKVITKDRSKADEYLRYLSREIEYQATLLGKQRQVVQLHWGGGTPNFLNNAQMTELMQVTRQHFNLAEGDALECSIEVDPRTVTAESIPLLNSLGFNRISIGVQDFDPQVQKAVNRIQSEQQVNEIIKAARNNAFHSVSIDLIYGLPLQNPPGFAKTLDTVIAMSPDRLSLFNYAHLPTMFKPQRRIDADELPSPAEKLEILQQSVAQLTAAGYAYIGMDHFAKPADELAKAQSEGVLHRNFQGYTTHGECDLVGLGVSSISSVGDCYSQNLKDLPGYYAALDSGQMPVMRGVVVNADDHLRRDVINQLICHFELDFARIEHSHQIDFKVYFADELNELKSMQGDGLLQLGENGITVLPAGRFLIRNICMVFDRYLREKSQPAGYSKVI